MIVLHQLLQVYFMSHVYLSVCKVTSGQSISVNNTISELTPQMLWCDWWERTPAVKTQSSKKAYKVGSIVSFSEVQYLSKYTSAVGVNLYYFSANTNESTTVYFFTVSEQHLITHPQSTPVFHLTLA